MRKLRNGFTLIEVLVTAGIVIISMLGLFKVFIYASRQAELSGDITYAMSEVQSKIEEIRNHTYSFIADDYAEGGDPGNITDLTLVNGKLTVYVDSGNPDLLEIEVVACWQTNDGRIIGEDLNLNGTLEKAQEDLNDDDRLDSPTSSMILIAKR